MKGLLLEARRARFGRSSEKRSYVLEEGGAQLNLFDEAEVEHSLASPSTVADVMTKKYVDGLPLPPQYSRSVLQRCLKLTQNLTLPRADERL